MRYRDIRIGDLVVCSDEVFTVAAKLDRDPYNRRWSHELRLTSKRGRTKTVPIRSVHGKDEYDRAKALAEQKDKATTGLCARLSDTLDGASVTVGGSWMPVLVALNADAAARLLDRLEAKRMTMADRADLISPTDPNYSQERRSRMRRVSGRLRRAIGEGYSGSYMGNPPREIVAMLGFSVEEGERLLARLTGGDQSGSSLEDLIGALI
jgi:hypothetical protein